MIKQSSARKSKGFTFLEIVIAITILAVIMGTTYSSLSQIIRSKKILDDARDGKAIADALLTRLLRELQLTLPDQPIMPPRNELDRPIIGEPRLTASRSEQLTQQVSNLTFITMGSRQLLPDGTRQSDVVQISYYSIPDQTDPSNERLILVRQEVPYIRPFEDAYMRSISFPVAKDLISFDFLFFDENNNQWLNFWPPKSGDLKRLPTMIQLLFRLRSPLGAVQAYSTIVYIPSSQT